MARLNLRHGHDGLWSVARLGLRHGRRERTRKLRSPAQRSGFACEPTVVYLVCNQHTYTAEKLYDAIYQSSSNKRLTSEAKKWLHYLNTTAVRQKPIGPLGEGFFEILYQEQLKDLFGFNWVEIADVGGCAANDGWASTVMGFWAANDKGVGKDLVERVRSSIANNNGWVEVGKKTAEVEEKDHGHFYEGDSYICLKTVETKSGGFNWDIFFWLGKDSSQDEQAVAAYKTVELDDLLDGRASHHREVMGAESEAFKAHFDHKLKYVAGGAPSCGKRCTLV